MGASVDTINKKVRTQSLNRFMLPPFNAMNHLLLQMAHCMKKAQRFFTVPLSWYP
jgi:hypothetical protein